MTTTTAPAAAGAPVPRNVFLTAKEVIARYGWGRTYGYQMLVSNGFPKPIGGRYRLDTLMTWEDRVLSGELPGRPDPRVETSPSSSSTAIAPDADAEPAAGGLAETRAATTATPSDPVQAPTRRRTRGARSAA